MKMIDHGKTRSTERPEPMKIDDYSVWVYTNIEIVTDSDGNNEVESFEYDMIQYDKDEYIKLMAEQSDNLRQQVTGTQLALCELYEGMV